MGRFNYLKYYLNNVNSFFITKQRVNKIPEFYDEKNILSQYDGANYIENLILSNKPFAVCRFGSTELGCFHNYEKIRLGFTHKFKQSVIYTMKNNAGFFPSNNENLNKFGELMESMYSNIDLIAIFNIFMEDYVISKYCKTSKLTVIRSVDPIQSNWTKSLKGKKVLVIHPYAELIEEQYKNRKLLFENNEKLPEFDLKVIQSVQTIADEKDDRFDTWFEALDYMMSEIKKVDFDIALIGAGAYGLPISVKIKTELKKQAIHIGGATQLLFGIKGKRWDNRGDFNCFYNEYWIRPTDKFKPKNSEKVENSCYW